MVSYLVISAILLTLLGVIWTRKDIPNLLIKCIMLGIALWGWFMVLLEMGYVVRS
jgi:xanthine/uracil/vitamin C permease (AzgA family)